MRVVFFGNEQLAQGLSDPGTPAFDSLTSAGIEIVALVLPQDPSGSSRKKKPFKILEKAAAAKVPVIFANQFTDLDAELRNLEADFGVLASYGKIVKQSTIKVFRHGIINIHPSLLPKYRGTTPIETAILKGDPGTGVSIMQLTAQMDAGDILAQEKIPLTDQSKDELAAELADLGAKLLVKVLQNYNQITPRAQNEAEATFTDKLDKSQSLLRPESETALELVNRIRAFQGFPKAKIEINGQLVTVLAAHTSNGPVEPLEASFEAGDGRYLIVDQIVPENSKPMSVQAFLNGRRQIR